MHFDSSDMDESSLYSSGDEPVVIRRNELQGERADLSNGHVGTGIPVS